MRSTVLAIALAALAVGCGKKKPAQTTDVETIPSGFIQIDLSEEEEEFGDLVGSELSAAIAPCGDLVRLELGYLRGSLPSGAAVKQGAAEVTLLEGAYQAVQVTVGVALGG